MHGNTGCVLWVHPGGWFAWKVNDYPPTKPELKNRVGGMILVVEQIKVQILFWRGKKKTTNFSLYFGRTVMNFRRTLEKLFTWHYQQQMNLYIKKCSCKTTETCYKIVCNSVIRFTMIVILGLGSDGAFLHLDCVSISRWKINLVSSPMYTHVVLGFCGCSRFTL